MTSRPPTAGHANTRQVWMMASVPGAIVANIYYIQPLLSAIAADFKISVSTVGAIAMLSQLGTAVAMLVFVPLGDTKERRSLVVRLLLAATACLFLMASAQRVWWLGEPRGRLHEGNCPRHCPLCGESLFSRTTRRNGWHSSLRSSSGHFARPNCKWARRSVVRVADNLLDRGGPYASGRVASSPRSATQRA
jgi:hypothetical protein